MKDIENVTGEMGKGEAVAPAEEAAASSAEVPVDAIEATAAAAAAVDEGAAAASGADPWAALLQVGAQFVAALSSADAGVPHPWIERDPATGARNLKLPLPPAETTKRLADALSVLADTLRGGSL